MTKRQFKKLKVGDIVILNGQCRTNVGMECVVTYICDDRIWVQPIVGELKGNYCMSDWNEISYTAARVI